MLKTDCQSETDSAFHILECSSGAELVSGGALGPDIYS